MNEELLRYPLAKQEGGTVPSLWIHRVVWQEKAAWRCERCTTQVPWGGAGGAAGDPPLGTMGTAQHIGQQQWAPSENHDGLFIFSDLSGTNQSKLLLFLSITCFGVKP